MDVDEAPPVALSGSRPPSPLASIAASPSQRPASPSGEQEKEIMCVCVRARARAPSCAMVLAHVIHVSLLGQCPILYSSFLQFLQLLRGCRIYSNRVLCVLWSTLQHTLTHRLSPPLRNWCTHHSGSGTTARGVGRCYGWWQHPGGGASTGGSGGATAPAYGSRAGSSFRGTTGSCMCVNMSCCFEE